MKKNEALHRQGQDPPRLHDPKTIEERDKRWWHQREAGETLARGSSFFHQSSLNSMDFFRLTHDKSPRDKETILQKFDSTL